MGCEVQLHASPCRCRWCAQGPVPWAPLTSTFLETTCRPPTYEKPAWTYDNSAPTLILFHLCWYPRGEITSLLYSFVFWGVKRAFVFSSSSNASLSGIEDNESMKIITNKIVSFLSRLSNIYIVIIKYLCEEIIRIQTLRSSPHPRKLQNKRRCKEKKLTGVN